MIAWKRELWTWNWYGGGWNQCMAWNRQEALQEAHRIGAGHLVPIPSSVRRAPKLKMYERHLKLGDRKDY